MARYANQRTITTHKMPFGNNSANTRFLGISYDAAFMAMNILNRAGICLWMYFAGNKDGYKQDASRAAFENLGFSKNVWYDGWKELEKQGYIKKNEYGEYDFYEIPTMADE